MPTGTVSPGWGAVRGDAQDAAGKGLDLVEGLVAFHRKEDFAHLDRVAIGFEPFDEGALLHSPPQAGHCDCLGHGLLLLGYQVADGPFYVLPVGRDYGL